MPGNKDCAVKQRQPERCHRHYLHSQRNGLVLGEVRDVRSEFRMSHQPVMQILVPAQEQRRGQQQERSGGQHRQKCAQDSQSERNQPQYGQKYIHLAFYCGCKDRKYRIFYKFALLLNEIQIDTDMKKVFILCLLAIISAAAMAQTDKDWAKFYRYNEANAAVTVKPKAVFMGDSITDYWLKKDGGFFASNNFAGRGISGQTTSHMLVRFRRDVLDLAPKYVVILAGTNDIALNNGLITLENILGNIQSMCDLARAHKIKPVICSVLPAASYRWRKELQPAQDIVKLNAMLRAYAESSNIPYVDYHSVLKDENDGLPLEYAADGVHPGIECYKIMEGIILKVLK